LYVARSVHNLTSCYDVESEVNATIPHFNNTAARVRGQDVVTASTDCDSSRTCHALSRMAGFTPQRLLCTPLIDVVDNNAHHTIRNGSVLLVGAETRSC